MFNSLFKKVKNIWGDGDDVLKKTLPVKPKKSAIKADKNQDQEKNRVSFKKNKTKKVVKPQVVVSHKVNEAEVTKRVSQLVKKEIEEKEREVFQRLRSLDSKEKYLLDKERNVDKLSEQLTAKRDQVDELYKKQLDKLEQISSLSVSEAKDIIIKNTKKRMSDWVAKRVVEAGEEIKTKEDEIIQAMVLDNIHHGVTDYVAEYTISTIDLSDEKIKGKIIGREGRNIRTFEKITGVELELDEEDRVIISSFDPIRREVAKLSLEKLIKDGRIQPVRIEQVVKQTRLGMDKILLSEGQRICQEVGLYNLPTELIRSIGKYKYRFSYGQNLAKHSIEVAKLAGALAKELNVNVNMAKMAALVHDIGKVSDQVEGNHVDLGVEMLKKFRVPEVIIKSVEESHADKPFSSVISSISYLADAISGSRPGSRYDGHEEYLKRMKNIEKIAMDKKGVKEVAAYQAGREVMVIVDAAQVTDNEAVILAQEIAEDLEEEAKWAGRIRVTTVRETRSSFTKQKNNRISSDE